MPKPLTRKLRKKQRERLKQIVVHEMRIRAEAKADALLNVGYVARRHQAKKQGRVAG